MREAVRRGCSLITACPSRSVLAEHAEGRHSSLLPTQTDDTLAVAVVMLQALHAIGVGPELDADAVASVLDEVAVECSPHRDISSNPAKDIALFLADAAPLVWGGSVLAARAARRVAEAIRRTTGRPALAADAGHLLPVLDLALVARPVRRPVRRCGRRARAVPACSCSTTAPRTHPSASTAAR